MENSVAFSERGKRENLQRIGLVLHVTSNRNMILKAENLPRIGDHVMDENLNSAGTVLDIIGPTSSPYITVRPNTETPNGLIRHILYAAPSKPKPRREKRKR